MGACFKGHDFNGEHVLWGKISMETFSGAIFSKELCFTGVIFSFEGYFLKEKYYLRERYQCWITISTYLTYIESSVSARSYPSSSEVWVRKASGLSGNVVKSISR